MTPEAERDALAKKDKEKTGIINSHQCGGDNVFTHHRKDHSCDLRKRTKGTRGKCKTNIKEAHRRKCVVQKIWQSDNGRAQGSERQE